MNYQSFYNYVRDIALNLPDVSADRFFHGRREIIVPATPKDVYVYALPFEVSPSGFTDIGQQVNKVWNLQIIFYKKDQLRSAIDQNNQDVISDEMDILAQTFDLAEQFLREFNYNIITPELEAASDVLIIQSFNIEPAIKDTPHILTGCLLTMSVLVPDNFNYCEIV